MSTTVSTLFSTSFSATFHTSNAITSNVLTFADELRNCGVEEDVDLPQIIVVGDQSSGKSSVLEAISGAPLPRSDGLTTRCAIQFTLRQQSEWRAEVRTRGPGDGVSVDTVTTVETVEALGEAVYKAQMALCGDRDFAPDSIVEVKMWGPNVPNLTLIDLPGLIRTTTDGQDASVKEDVRKMVEGYMERRRSIILAVIPANVDLATTEVIELAQAVDPDGERTVGVLTKPDLIDPGAETSVLRVLRNETKPLTHGYWVVRNRGQAQVKEKTSAEAARKAEQQYFDENGHFAKFRERTGVTHLTEMLTKLLVHHIIQSLQPLENELKQLYSTACDEHRELGESPPTTRTECRQRLLATNKRVIEQLREATSDSGSLTTQMASLHKNTKNGLGVRILRTRPPFVTEMIHVTYFDTKSETWTMKIPGHQLHMEKDTARVHAGNVPPTFEDVCFLAPVTILEESTTGLEALMEPSSKYKAYIMYDEDGEGEVVLQRNKDNEEMCRIPVKDFTLQIVKRDTLPTPATFLNDVQTKIAQHRGRALPNFPSFSVFVNYMREYVDQWETPTKEIAQMLCGYTDTLLEDVVSTDPTLSKHKALRGLVKKCLEEVRQELETRLVASLDTVLNNERQPSTDNHYYMDTLNKIRNERMTMCIDKALDSEKTYSAQEVRLLIAGVTAQTVGNVSNDEQEAQDMVDSLRSYWKVAYKRFVDNVRQCLDETFVKLLADRCDTALGDRLMSLDNVKPLFDETARTRARRKEVEGRVKRLKAAVEKCATFVSPLKRIGWEGIDAGVISAENVSGNPSSNQSNTGGSATPYSPTRGMDRVSDYAGLDTGTGFELGRRTPL